MVGPCTNLPEVPWCDRTVAVLVVSPSEETISRLRGIFQHTNWALYRAVSCRDATEFLKRNVVAIAVCEYNLPDGNWKRLLDATATLPSPPLLIVTSAHADDNMWSEVLNLGGYDILPMPFERSEVTRIISLAWLHWKESMEARPLVAKPAAKLVAEKALPALGATA